jgi:F-type H+-transporting ATPase subunit delta
MAELSVVRRYARALFDTALQMEQIDQVEQDLKAVDQLLRAEPRLERVLRAPTISGPRKQEVVRRAFEGRVGALTLRFLNLTVNRRREDILGGVYREYQRLANEHRNLLPVEAVSAVPLLDEEREALGRALAQRTGKRIMLRVSTDPALMGGVVVRMGDTIIDSSVRTRLEQLRDRLLAGRLA